MIANEDEFTNRPELIARRARAILWTRLGIAVLLAYCVLSLGFIIFASVLGFQQRTILVDCTTPGGRCYNQSQKGTGEAVENIGQQTKDIATLAAYCAQANRPEVSTLAEIETCINKNLER